MTTFIPERFTVHESSWHYKLFKLAHRIFDNPNAEPTSGCSYFWTLVLSPVALVLGIFGRVGIGFAKGLGSFFGWIKDYSETLFTVVITAIVTCVLMSWLFYDWLGFLKSFGVAALIILAICVCGIFAAGCGVLRTELFPPKEKEYVEKSSNVAISFLKAKKNRYCPIVEVIRDIPTVVIPLDLLR